MVPIKSTGSLAPVFEMRKSVGRQPGAVRAVRVPSTRAQPGSFESHLLLTQLGPEMRIKKAASRNAP